jgi:8-oxo-dGTP diphosphatase
MGVAPSGSAALPPVEVVAGALVDSHGRVLIAARPPGKEFAGRWEFPGGKRHAGESPRAALDRELREELGIEVAQAAPLLTVAHRYPGASAGVVIDCWRVEAWHGEPAALDGQALRWCTRDELAAADLLEADRPIVTALLLPGQFVHVEATDSLDERSATVPGRAHTAWLVHAMPPDTGVARRLAEHGDRLFVIDPRTPLGGGVGAVYTVQHRFEPATSRHAPAGQVVHSAAEALAARAAGADFLLVPRRRLPPAELAGIVAAGLPWYRDEGPPGEVDDADVSATGRLWWAGLPIDRL